MEPEFKPKWTRDDTRLMLQLGAAFIGIGAITGYGSGDGILWGAAGGVGLIAIIAILALVRLAYYRLLS